MRHLLATQSAPAPDGVECCLPNEVAITNKHSDALCTIPLAICETFQG